jgi:ABC-type nitrate/sulfonate/bicarbonate transport system substrate-binding protein
VTGRAMGWPIVIACVLQLQACAAQPPSRQTSPGSVRLRVLVLPSLSAAPLFVAADGGYFAGQGLDVEFVKVTRSTVRSSSGGHSSRGIR